MRGPAEVLALQLAGLAATAAVVTLIRLSLLPFEAVLVAAALNLLAAALTRRPALRALHLAQSGASVAAASPPATELLPHVVFTYRGMEIAGVLEVLTALQGVVWIVLAVLQAVYIYSLMVRG